MSPTDEQSTSIITTTNNNFFSNHKRIILAISATIFLLILTVATYTILSIGKGNLAVTAPSAENFTNGAKLIDDPLASDKKAILMTNAPAATAVSPKEISQKLPQVTSATPVYMSSSQQAPPTNRWFSSLAFFHDNNMAVFAHPLNLKTQSNGFQISGTKVVGTANTVYGSATPDVKFDFGAQTWNYVNYYDDMMVKTDFKSGDTTKGTLTMTHGSPYAYVTLPANGTVAISGDSLTKLKNNYYSFKTGDNTYAIAWDTNVTLTSSDGKLSLKAKTADALVSLAVVPNGVTTDDLYATALNQIVGTQVEGVRSSDTWQTTFTIKTKNDLPTYFGFLPNETAGIATASSGTFDTLYGKMKVYKGNRFVSQSAVKVPASSYDVASYSDTQKTTLKALVKADIAKLSFPSPDTYFGGKALAKAATLYDMAKQLGLDQDAQAAHDKVLAEFATWFDPNGCNTRGQKCFVYDKNLHGVVGKEYAFGDEEMNDHHFHYGYWLAAGAIMAKYDKSFIDTYGSYIDMLAKDYANTDRNDTFSPYIRSYDLYTGHSWAAGLSPFADGNNNESSSEAVNAYYGLYQWASVTGNSSLSSNALWLYDRESAAALSYWTNIDKSATGYDKFSAPFVSMLWGGKRDYATWFSASGEAKLAIQVLPLTPASLYLGVDKARVSSNLQAAAPAPTAYKDILVGYKALADASAAQAQLGALADADIDDGDTRSNLQAFIYYSQKQSAESKKPLQAVAGCSVKTNGASAATVSIDVATTGTYRIWLRTTAGQVSVKINDNCPQMLDNTATSGYGWVGTSNGQAYTTQLSAGTQKITLYGMTTGIKIDKLSLVTSLTCTPTDVTGACNDNSTPVVVTPPPTDTPPTTPPVTTDPTPPTTENPTPMTPNQAPSNLHAAGSTAKTITLAWDGSATGSYEVLRSGIRIATVTGTSFTDIGLLPNTPYVYSIRGYTVTTPNVTMTIASDGSIGSGQTTTTPAQPTQSTDAPTNLRVASTTASTITLAWNGKQSGSYEVLRSGIKIASVTGTTFTDVGLLPNTPYIYSVRGYGVTTPTVNASIK